MSIRFSIWILLLFQFYLSYAQTFQPLPLPLNMPLGAEANPTLTGNGRTLVYEAAIGNNERPMVAISYQKAGIWSRPEEVPGISTKSEQLFNGAHFITFEGNFIFFASNRHGGVGSNDLYFVEKEGAGWKQPVNLAKPINSIESETDPALSPDGRWLYFVRYNSKKTTTGKPCGKIFVSERKGKGAFLEPIELPPMINKGCECNPRILSDNVTMTFASEKPGGKGGYDQYRSELLENGTWTSPVSLEFINTPEDDLYNSIPAGGDFIYLTGKSKVATDIVRTRIPANHRPKNVLLLTGKVKDKNAQPSSNTLGFLNSKVGVQKEKNNKTNFSGTEEGNFVLFLPEKNHYNITFSAKGYSFYSLLFNLDTLSRFREIKTDVELVALKRNNIFPLYNDALIDSSGKFLPSSFTILNNLFSFLKENPGIGIEIISHSNKILRDSIVHPGLTEVAHDTTVNINNVAVHFPVLYHNDRSIKEANAVKQYLVQKGIEDSRVSAIGSGDTKPCNPNALNGVKCFNRRVEILITTE